MIIAGVCVRIYAYVLARIYIIYPPRSRWSSVGGGYAEGAPPVRWTVYIRRQGGALPPIVLANEKVGRAPARSLPLRRPSVGMCPRGWVDASMLLPLPLQYVCKSCRLAVTREDCSSSGGFLVCRHHRRRRDGLIGSFNPSGHLAERARRPPPPYRRPPPPVLPPGARLSVVIIPIYLFILTRYIRTFKYMIRLRGGLRSIRRVRGRGVTSIGRRFFPLPPPRAYEWPVGAYEAPPISVRSFLFPFDVHTLSCGNRHLFILRVWVYGQSSAADLIKQLLLSRIIPRYISK